MLYVTEKRIPQHSSTNHTYVHVHYDVTPPPIITQSKWLFPNEWVSWRLIQLEHIPMQMSTYKY